jgi:hypothetical protein
VCWVQVANLVYVYTRIAETSITSSLLAGDVTEFCSVASSHTLPLAPYVSFQNVPVVPEHLPSRIFAQHQEILWYSVPTELPHPFQLPEHL